MLTKIVPTNEVPLPLWLQKRGDFNTMPEPFKQIPEEDFWKEFMTWPAFYQEYRQIRNLPEISGFADTKIFWLAFCAVAIVQVEPGNLLFFRIGCHHEWSETKIGNCLHRRVCNLCGWATEIDSSG